jgi:hypothetical protein
MGKGNERKEIEELTNFHSEKEALYSAGAFFRN